MSPSTRRHYRQASHQQPSPDESTPPANQLRPIHPRVNVPRRKAVVEPQLNEPKRLCAASRKQVISYYFDHPKPAAGSFLRKANEPRQAGASSSGSGTGSGHYRSSESLSSEGSYSGLSNKEEENPTMQQMSNASSAATHEETMTSTSDTSDTGTMITWCSRKRDLLEKHVSVEARKQLEMRNRVTYREIFWDKVAAKIPGETEQACKSMWIKMYPDHIFTKHSDGSIVVMKKIGTCTM